MASIIAISLSEGDIKEQVIDSSAMLSQGLTLKTW